MGGVHPAGGVATLTCGLGWWQAASGQEGGGLSRDLAPALLVRVQDVRERGVQLAAPQISPERRCGGLRRTLCSRGKERWLVGRSPALGLH